MGTELLTTSGNGVLFSSTGTSTAEFRQWLEPDLIETVELEDSIEFIYEEYSSFSTTGRETPRRVFKIIFSCVDGKWNKSERIYGSIIPATEETYSFEGQPV